MKKSTLFVLLALLISGSFAHAAPLAEGWHKGPYLLGSVGVMNFDQDTDVFNKSDWGDNYPIAWGFTAGYNWRDFAAVEIQGRYVSDKSNGRSEDFGSLLLNFKYSIISSYFTQVQDFHLLPYLKAGAGAFAAKIPGNGGDVNTVVPEVSVGGGAELVITKHLYVGSDLLIDFAFLKDKKDSAGNKVIQGGLDPQISLNGYLGIRF